MDETHVKVNLKIKTGFFKTEPAVLLLQQQSMKLISVNNVTIPEEVIDYSSIKTICITDGNPAELEIRTDKAAIIGTFSKSADIGEIVKILKKIFDIRFLYI